MSQHSDFGPTERSRAREEIRDLVARYNANGDTGRFAQVKELFAEDAVMRIEPGQELTGRDAIMTIFSGATATTGPLTHVRHFTSTHQIDFEDAEHASGRLYFAVLTDVGLDHWGRYVDRYVRTVEGWKFSQRSVSVDGWSDGSLFPRL